jgi:hypothetical protein
MLVPARQKENLKMQPQSGKKKPKHPASAVDGNGVALRTPVTALGQRYVSPAGRHNQQSHRLGALRASEAGHASEKEQHAHDRTATTAKIAKTASDLEKNKLQSSQRK